MRKRDSRVRAGRAPGPKNCVARAGDTGADDLLAPLVLAVHRQLALVPAPPRDLAAGGHNAVADLVLARWLGQELAAWAAARGWARSTTARARTGLRLLLTLQAPRVLPSQRA
ncbi:hypothetical protein [Streptomyces torulosus]|uniref:hypothetical protein n=1 Tax=Streptomyces torulosus TaxID=68276 RepID=UPI0012FECD2E|nr:hypothetical protein [Streptomyces torulosus]